MMKNYCYLLIAFMFFLPLCPACAQTQLAKGEGMFTYADYAPFSDRPIDVHYYIPFSGDQSDMPIIFVFQGADRVYGYLLDAWKREAEAKGFMVFVPQFDIDKYPTNDYQELGIMDKNCHCLRSLDRTTPILIDKIFEYVQKHTLTQRQSYRIYGHSAGGQFVHRFMLFHESPYVDRAIIGSPGWYTFPDSTMDYPYGIKNVPYVTKVRLRRYFEKDIILQLATGDTIRESYLRKTPEAEAQGRNRYERGLQYYRFLQTLSSQENLPLRWRKVIVDSVGHQSVEMGMAAIPLLLESSSVEFKTPSMESGKFGFATMGQIATFYADLQKAYPDKMTVEVIGTTPEGKDVLAVSLGKENPESLKVWIQGGLHGNEPAGPEVVAFLTKYLLTTEKGKHMLEHLNICMIPVANPDGYSRGERFSGSGYDLNRDMTKLSDPVSRMLKRKYMEWNPDAALDIHEYNPIKKELKGADGHQLSFMQDVLFLPSGHLNISSRLLSFTNQKLYASLFDAAEKMGYTYGVYFTPREIDRRVYAMKGAKSPQSSSTWNGLSNAVSCFIEIKGIGMGKTLLDKRVDCGFSLANEFLSYLLSNKQEVKKTVSQAKTDACLAQDDIHVVMKASVNDDVFTFWDDIEGRQKEELLPVQDATRMVDVVTRKRPTAYLLDASNKDVVEKLRLSGVQVSQLLKEQKINVEEYKMLSCSVSEKRWEKIHTVSVEVKVRKRKKRFPRSTYVVPVNQVQGNLLVTLLEPESNNGFVHFGVVPVDNANNTVPIFRTDVPLDHLSIVR